MFEAGDEKNPAPETQSAFRTVTIMCPGQDRLIFTNHGISPSRGHLHKYDPLVRYKEV